jgi:hypothetical protein
LDAQAAQSIDPAVLERDKPKIDPKADAEIIYWRTRIEDRLQGTSITLVRSQYAIIKIYTDRGREDHSTIDLMQVRDGNVKHSFSIGGGAIPAKRYAELRQFLPSVDAAAQASVVLQKR